MKLPIYCASAISSSSSSLSTTCFAETKVRFVVGEIIIILLIIIAIAIIIIIIIIIII